MNFKQIYEGWRNKLFPPEELKEIIETVANYRLAICEECGEHSKFHKSIRLDAHCTICECTLSAKTRCLSCECPLNKWDAVMTEQQEDEISNT